MSATCYYVYILFDWLGIPRYVGKGKGKREEAHEKSSDPVNWMKNEFSERTWIVLGEIPKIRVHENLSEKRAYEFESVLIKAIGRLNNGTGPLTNLRDGNDASNLTPEIRSLAGRRGMATLLRKLSPERLFEIRSSGSRQYWSSMTSEERSAELTRRNHVHWSTLTPKQRFKRVQKSRLSVPVERRREISRKGNDAQREMFTHEELSERQKSLDAKRTPEQRSARGKKAWKTTTSTRTSEEISEMKRQASLAYWSKLTVEERSAHGTRVNAKLTPQQHTEKGLKAWTTRRKSGSEVST